MHTERERERESDKEKRIDVYATFQQENLSFLGVTNCIIYGDCYGTQRN